jgi:hypothetical protein
MDRSENSTARECTFCAEARDESDFVQLIGHEHQASVCRDCSAAWVAHKINRVVWCAIGCPEPGCKRPLSYEDLEQVAAPEEMRRQVLSLAAS